MRNFSRKELRASVAKVFGCNAGDAVSLSLFVNCTICTPIAIFGAFGYGCPLCGFSIAALYMVSLAIFGIIRCRDSFIRRRSYHSVILVVGTNFLTYCFSENLLRDVKLGISAAEILVLLTILYLVFYRRV